MALTVADIKNMLAKGEISPNFADAFADGLLTRFDGARVQYTAHFGWDIAKAYACDHDWGTFNVRILSYINENFKDQESENAALAQTSLEDYHWEWFEKAAFYKSDQYRWYFLLADGSIQAACLIFQPKESAFQAGEIFYVEYIAVAPWNRPNPMQNRTYLGVGTRILKHAVDHCTHTLNLKPGFSLHALPKAIPFYKKIGMLPHPASDKDQLPYYEMPESALAAFAS